MVSKAPRTGERRMFRRLLGYWQGQCAGRPFPAIVDIQPEAIADIWSSCFVLDPVSNPHFPYFRYLGPSLAQYVGVLLSGQSDWALGLLDKAMYNCRAAIETQAPVLTEDEVPRLDGTRFLFRSILLPLADGGRRVRYLLGAANGTVRAP